MFDYIVAVFVVSFVGYVAAATVAQALTARWIRRRRQRLHRDQFLSDAWLAQHRGSRES